MAKEVIITSHHPISDVEMQQLNMLADINNCPVDLLIEAFIISTAHPEAAFPYFAAETFLDSVINSIHYLSPVRVVHCHLEATILRVRVEVSRAIYMEWINDR